MKMKWLLGAALALTITAPVRSQNSRMSACTFAASRDGGGEKLAIFGTRRARRGAELKVMSAVEHKHPGARAVLALVLDCHTQREQRQRRL
jgi:hypothetical protein